MMTALFVSLVETGTLCLVWKRNGRSSK